MKEDGEVGGVTSEDGRVGNGGLRVVRLARRFD